MHKHPLAVIKAKGFMLPRTQRIKTPIFSILPRRLSVALAGLLLTAGLVVMQVNQASAAPAPLVLGELPYQKMLTYPLSDSLEVSVNAANGNLLLKMRAFEIRGGAGPDLSVTQYFNQRGSNDGSLFKDRQWKLSVGPDIKIAPQTNGSAIYHGPSGFKIAFPSNGSGGYNSPANFKYAKLTKVTGGGWKLTFNKSGEVYQFNSSGKQTKHINRTGQAIIYTYDSSGQLQKATDDQGKVTTFFTDLVDDYLMSINTPDGKQIQYGYNGSGKLNYFRDASGNEWRFGYNTNGKLVTIEDPRLTFTAFEYDSLGRVTKVKRNFDVTTADTYTYTYNDGNTVVTDPLKHKTTYSYDASGRVTSVRDAVGANRGVSWDANSNQTAIQDPSSQVTTFTYDSLNNLTKQQNPNTAGGAAGAAETYAYANPAHPHRPSKKTDAGSNTIAYSYNVSGSVTTAASASANGTGMGSVTNKYQGDPNGSGGTINCGAKAGQICSSTDARNNTTTYAYDIKGNVTTITPPGPVGVKKYTYDALSRVKTITDGNNSKVTITYDSADRPTLLTYANDSSTVSYEYDANGNLLKRVDAAGTTIWVYDGLNRITKMKQSGKPDLNYAYDAAGNLKTEQGPAGTTTYHYDAANQIATIVQPDGSDHSFVFTDGRPTTVYLPGNITQTIRYDQAGRQTSIKAVGTNGTLTDYTGTYTNAAGKDTKLLQTEVDNLAGITSKYSYDGLNRLVDVNGSGSGSDDYTYKYDANGNRTQQSKNGVYSAIYGYNAANQFVTDGGAESGTFDQAGNQTSTGTGLWFDYNAKNQTSAFTPPGASAITASYSDIGQTSRTQIGGTAQRNGALGLYSDTTGSTATYYTRTPTGTSQPISQTTGSNNYSYLTDLRGSVVKLTDGAGTVKATYTYEPYGKALTSSGTVNSPHRYAGGYYDSSTELYKFGARYYNPEDARWTQLDPSGQEYGYMYANANPVNFVDPSGYFSLEQAGQTGYEYSEYGGYIGAGIGCAAGATPLIAAPPVAAAGCLSVGALGYETGVGVGFVAGFLKGGLSD